MSNSKIFSHYRTVAALLVFFVSLMTAMMGQAADCVTPLAGLVGWWPGDGGATNYFGTNNGTFVAGATATNAGMVGLAFKFDGVNNAVSVPDSPSLRPTNFTVETWVRFNSLDSSGNATAGQQYIVFKQNTRSTVFEGIYLAKQRGATGDYFAFAVSSSTGSSVEVDSTSLVQTGLWYHVAAVRGPNYLQLYVNGQLQRQATVNFAQNYGTLPLFFGSSGASWDRKLNGLLDEVSMYNRPLSSNEIAAVYNAGSAGKCKAANGLLITGQPQNQNVIIGSNATFTVTATGNGALSYQWQFGGAPIAGATTSALGLTGVQLTDAGNYRVVVTNATGALTSAVATLTVLIPPVITTSPQSLTNLSGTTAIFTASATGTGPLSYRWRLNGTSLNNGGRISGATNDTLTISNLQAGDAGNYTLLVINAAGSAISDPATLTVNGPPVITIPPSSKTVAVGANTSFTVTATGTAPLSYQWQKGGVDIADATGTALQFTSAQTLDSGDYTVVVGNPFASVTSMVATLTVLLPPAITSDPQSITNTAGATAVFSATATGSAPLSYRWLLNGVALNNGARITGATGNTLTITGLQAGDAGNYTLNVTNAVGTATSAAATLTLSAPPSITQQPASQNAVTGSNVTFSVVAAGAQPLRYQWRKNGGAISGATASAFAMTNVQTNDNGSYQVVVTNNFGSVTSTVASLTVGVPANCLSAPSGLLGWWPGDGNANDIFSSNHGLLQGGATVGGVGRVGAGFNFDGTNNYVQIPDSPSLRPTNFTIEAWIKFDALNSAGNASAGQQYIVFKQNTRSSLFEGFYLGKERSGNNDTFVFAAYPATGGGVSISSTTLISTGVWYHVAAVRGPTTAQLFVNGQMQAQSTATFIQSYGNFPLYLGTSGQSFWDRKFKGVLDEVSLYSRALSAAEITAIYAAGAGGKCKGAAPPSIITQPASKVYAAGGTTTFTVVAAGSEPLSYQWFRDGLAVIDDGRVLGSKTASLTLTSMQAVDIGNYHVGVTNALGWVLSSTASLNTGLAPTNDNFASAVSIGGISGTVNGNNANAARQSGEPNHAGNTGPSSVWYNWTAPSASPVTIDTTMSAFDTLLAVYTGNAVNALTAVTSNNNISTNNSRSRVSFTPVAGTVYRIAVDGANGANGNLKLRWVQASVALPDLIILGSAVNPRVTTETFSSASCAVAEGLVPAGTRKLIRFDTQTANQGGADLIFGNPANNSLFVFANCHAHYHFQNYMSYRLRNTSGQIAAIGLKVGFCVLDVFRFDAGSAVSAKYDCGNQGIQKGWGDLYDSTLDGQWIDITGLPDGNYTMEMEANPLGIIQESNYGNNVTIVPITIGNSSAPPPNDTFASAQTLLGTSPSVTGTTTNATKQAGEPNHAGNAGGHSIWYNWTAPATKAVTIDTIGSSFNTLLGVYTGSAVGSLSAVASNDDIVPGTSLQSRVTFNAIAGTLYRIAVDGVGGVSGNIVLTVNQTVANDSFAACIFTGGVQGSIPGSTVGATKETNEPSHGGNTGGQSIWYCWTAPVGGTVAFDTVGSTFNTLLGVYTGNSVGGLTLVAGNDNIDTTNLQSRVTFNAVGLTMYHIAIDGFNGDAGNTRLNWSLSAAAPASALLASLRAEGSNSASPADGQASLKFNLLTEGMCQLAITGQPQQRYRIERSCDLQTWMPLATTVADLEGHAWFTDKAARHLKTGSGDAVCGSGQILGVAVSPTEARFYRAVPLP